MDLLQGEVFQRLTLYHLVHLQEDKQVVVLDQTSTQMVAMGVATPLVILVEVA